jgi:anthranilate/para-aminobenzoate synthase component I
MQKDTKNIDEIVYLKIIDENYTIQTIEQLCKLIGISKKTFYKEYPSKEQFILNLLSIFNNETASELEKIIDNEYELVTNIIDVIFLLAKKIHKRNTIQKCLSKNTKLSEYLEEEFETIFTNTISNLLDKMNENNFMNSEINFYMFSEVLVKFTIDALKNSNLKNNENNDNLMVNNLLINALKGICNISEHKKIHEYSSVQHKYAVFNKYSNTKN